MERGGRFDGIVRSALGINTLALLVLSRLSIFTQLIQTSLPSERHLVFLLVSFSGTTSFRFSCLS